MHLSPMEGGKFVLVNISGYIFTSTDGENWAQTFYENCIPMSIIYGNGKFVAIMDSQRWFCISTDGENWTKIPIVSGQFFRVTYGNGKFIAVGRFLEGNYLQAAMTSTDGINWTKPVQVANETASFKKIVYGSGKFVAVGGNNSTNAFAISSIDGISWTDPFKFNTWYCTDVVYSNGKFVLCNILSYFSSSTDGERWTEMHQIRNENG